MVTASEDAADPLLYRLPEFPSEIPIAPSPMMSPCDSDGVAALITVSGVAFPALVVGGEPRVPVHLLFSRLLATQRVSEVEAMMDDLNIHKSLANSDHTDRLRIMDVEVSNNCDCSNMNLITRTDAERICGILRIESDCSSANDSVVEESERLSVQHNMFGTVNGWVYPSRKGGRSVRCQKCQYFFTPQDFVAHSHNWDKDYKRTVHWGFDPSNWRLMLELVKPSSEYNTSWIRWKEFIDEPVETFCYLESSESHLTNKRSLADHSMEVPTKVARLVDMPQIWDERLLAGPTTLEYCPLLRLPFYENLINLLGSRIADTLSALGDAMQKETAFKIKSFASVFENPSMPGVGQLLLPTDLYPVSRVSNTSHSNLVSDTVMQLKSNCGKLEYLELALKRSANIDPALINALHEIRTSLMEGTLAEFERLKTVCDFLFATFRQSCDPLSSNDDPLMQTVVANLRAEHVALGIANSNNCSNARSSDDLLQFSNVNKSIMNAMESPKTG